MSIRWSNLLGYTKLYAVPCPYFLPIAPRIETEWFRAPRSPLGALYAGTCHASSQPEITDTTVCNVGYARGQCPRFPQDAVADAVRFAETAGGLICILEKGCLPLSYVPVADLTDPILQAQARAFARSNPAALGE